MITIQRVRVRWGAASRGAPHANARRGLNAPADLPRSLPDAEVVIHDVLADEATGYERHEKVRHGELKRARDAALRLSQDGPGLVVAWLPPSAAYPRRVASTRLFTLQPGEVGQFRANFRFTGCACAPQWWYEDWLIRVGAGVIEDFAQREPAVDLDHRVHLYGGSAR